jgi:hypothetical protein
MNPFKTGLFSLEVISHKLLRWLIPIFLVNIAVGSIILSYSGMKAFQLLVILETIFLWLAMVGNLLRARNHIPALFFYPYYFLMVNFYSLKGIAKALQGDIQITWSSPRQEGKNKDNTLTEIAINIFILISTLILINQTIKLL